MNTPTTFIELATAMANGTRIQIGATVGIINAIEREDGSGKCFNVKLWTGVMMKSKFIRFSDSAVSFA